MKLNRMLGSCAAILLLSMTGVTGAGSSVADAVMKGDQAALRALVEQKADVNVPQADGATALHWAVYRGDAATATLLIRAGANVKAANRDGATALSLASINGDAEMVTALLKAGADANEELPLGKTPLMLAARTGKVEAIKALLDAGAKINAKEALRGTTPLMWAADEGHPSAVKLLLERGADIKARSSAQARGTGPALGKANDPRKQVAAQGAALAAGQASPDLNLLRDVGNGGAAAPAGAAPAGAAAPAAAARGGARAAAAATPAVAAAPADQAAGDAAAAAAAAAAQDGGGRRRNGPADGGALTALSYATRANDIESVKILLAAGADVNETTGYGWSPLLIATQNRYYKLGAFLLDKDADPNLTNKGGWTPLYVATDNRNIENGDYPVRKGDMDHLEFIQLLLDKGADVNARVKDSTETRTVFTNQWLDENGATAFLRASQSGDLILMRLLLSYGADPKIATTLNVTALQVASGIGWVDGITTEWSEANTLAAVKFLLDLGLDPNVQSDTGRTALHGAAHKGSTAVVQVLVDHGAKLDIRDYGNTDNRGGKLAVHTWQPVDYADGLVRVGVQSAIPHPETGALLRKLMTEKGLQAPPMGRTLDSICITEACE